MPGRGCKTFERSCSPRTSRGGCQESAWVPLCSQMLAFGTQVQMAEHARKWLSNVDENTKMLVPHNGGHKHHNVAPSAFWNVDQAA